MEDTFMANKVRVSYNIDEDVKTGLNVRAAELKVTKSELVERFIREGIERTSK